jgi:hypothetical protein
MSSEHIQQHFWVEEWVCGLKYMVFKNNNGTLQSILLLHFRFWFGNGYYDLKYMVFENNSGPLQSVWLPFRIEVLLESLPAHVVITVHLLASFFSPLRDSKTQ